MVGRYSYEDGDLLLAKVWRIVWLFYGDQGGIGSKHVKMLNLKSFFQANP